MPVKHATVNIPRSHTINRFGDYAVVDIDSILPHPDNYREHGGEQIGNIQEALEEYGVWTVVPVSRRADGSLVQLGKHALVKSAREAGWTQMPVFIMDGLEPEAELAILVGDNELSYGGVDDKVKLLSALDAIKANPFMPFRATGFDFPRYDNLVKSVGDSIIAAGEQAKKVAGEIADGAKPKAADNGEWATIMVRVPREVKEMWDEAIARMKEMGETESEPKAVEYMLAEVLAS